MAWFYHSLVNIFFLLAGSYICIYVVYNLFFHPLVKIPGPKLAAASWFWLFYSDLKGSACDNISDFHKQYGPVVRISPNEVSILDIDVFYKIIYAQNSKYHKAKYYYHAFHKSDASIFSETNRATHAKEKRLMSHAFSRVNLLGYQKVMYENTRVWVQKLSSYAESGQVIPLWNATRCLTLDIVSGFSFGSTCAALKSTDFRHPIFTGLEIFPVLVVWFQFIPMLKPVLWTIQGLLSAGSDPIRKASEDTLERLALKRQQQETSGMIMFESMITRAESSGIDLATPRLVQNGGLMLGAGTDTTALVLTTAIYHLTEQPDLWRDLQDVLLNKFPNSDMQPDVIELENIPLLDACINEALRVSVPIRGRFPREVPEGGLSCHGHYIPEGCFVCSSASFYCHDAVIFPEPEKFIPGRWLHTENSSMRRHLAVFSHGSTACIGKNFAQMELYIALYSVIINFSPGNIVDRNLGFYARSLTSPDTLAKVTLKPLIRAATT